MCFIAAVALSMRFDLPEGLAEFAGGSRALNIFYNFQLSLTGTMAVATLIFAALLLAERYLSRKNAKRGVFLYVICFLIAVVWAMGESFRLVDSLALWHAGAGQVVKTIVYIVGVTWVPAVWRIRPEGSSVPVANGIFPPLGNTAWNVRNEA